MAEANKVKDCERVLPKELIVEILSRLPVKSLRRFTCVSKAWFNLIYSSGPGSVQKIHDQRLKLKRIPYLVLQRIVKDIPGDSEKSLKRFASSEPHSFTVVDMVAASVHDKFELQFHQDYLAKVQSCHGLIIIWNFITFNCHYVCNPSTHEFIKIPRFISTIGPYAAGLGYLPSKDQYKVVIWTYSAEKSEYNLLIDSESSEEDDEEEDGPSGVKDYCQILTLTEGGIHNSSAWTRLYKHPSLLSRVYIHPKTPVSVSGVLYWALGLQKGRRSGNEEISYQIVLFDLEKEEFGMIPCPCSSVSMNMIEMKGRLCCGKFTYSNTMNIWVLNNDNSWECEYSLSLDPIGIPIQLLAHIPSTGLKDEEFVFVQTSQGRIIYYNPKSKSYREPQNLAHLRISRDDHLFVCSDSFFTL